MCMLSSESEYNDSGIRGHLFQLDCSINAQHSTAFVVLCTFGGNKKQQPHVPHPNRMIFGHIKSLRCSLEVHRVVKFMASPGFFLADFFYPPFPCLFLLIFLLSFFLSICSTFFLSLFLVDSLSAFESWASLALAPLIFDSLFGYALSYFSSSGFLGLMLYSSLHPESFLPSLL